MPTREFNFDGIVGPTHNYAGLGPGNLASQSHKHQASNPKAAALQGLAKMRFLHGLGVPQAVLPPPVRPDVGLLRRLGFSGDNAAVLKQAGREAPHLLAAAASASSMWAANAATVAPGADTTDGRVHFTPANLVSALHRSIEAKTTRAVLRQVFANNGHFAHHDPLPGTTGLGDEGAANHTRLCPDYGAAGVHLFVHGTPGPDPGSNEGHPPDTAHPRRFAPRQSRAASEAVARLHRLDPARVVFAQQHPDAIDAGVFHNDVIAVGDRDTLLYHERAFSDEAAVVDELRRTFARAAGANAELRLLRVTEDQLPLADAVRTYLFNSQLVGGPGGGRILIVPSDSTDHSGVVSLLDGWVASSELKAWHAVDVRQSMSNGGGPACLRLRVVLTDDQQNAMHQGIVFTPALESKLTAWVNAHYRDHLEPAHLDDPQLLDEARDAQSALGDILGMELQGTD